MHESEVDDAELLAAAARGESGAFTTLVRRYIRPATLLATQLIGDQDEAEDVVQDAFTIVYKKARDFDESRPFSHWLYGIVRKLAANKRIRDARRARLMQLWGRDSLTHENVNTTESVVAAKLDAEVVRVAMSSLSPMQRACFELVALHGLSAQEVAVMHAIAESTVRQHVFRARRTLSSVLQEQGMTHGAETDDWYQT